MIYDSGDGADGAITTAGNEDFNGAKWKGYNYKVSSISGTDIVCVNDPANIAAGDEILLLHMQGDASDASTPRPTNCAHVGKWEVLEVSSVNHGTKTITCAASVTNSSLDSGGKVFVQRVPNFTDVTISAGHTLSPQAWAGTDGNIGVIAFKASGTLTVSGTISASEKGFIGGTNGDGSECSGGGGESWGGAGGAFVTGGAANVGKGGGGGSLGTYAGGDGRTGGGGGGYSAAGSSYNGGGGGGGYSGNAGGGAGHGTAGQNGQRGNSKDGRGGAAVSIKDDDLGSVILLGAGGGSGGQIHAWSGYGGNGGGIIWISAKTISVGAAGNIYCDGEDGEAGATYSGGGGGAGGSIYLKCDTCTLQTNRVTAAGGSGGAAGGSGYAGGAGGVGIIALYSTSGTESETTSPANTETQHTFTKAGSGGGVSLTVIGRQTMRGAMRGAGVR